ncbi:prophage tail fiber N-terminal domain-containing protein [Serratia fonticola]|uniref:phage tail fiber protein n=1 Tax=Serratia fonticola TaxID=47917 RepID=UPI001648BD34|nr:prophage tail fiber N-terminal domain-containing protein [Serratia fonticola]MBC3253498.1 prophage tail fiber N-terminal domain-containing protein [Serratia fonticola]
MAVISGVLKGPMGDARVGVVIELRAVRTSATVVIQARSQSVTDATGRYTLSVEPGQYDVMITAAGRQPERVGGIQVMLNSATGTLNDFLTIPGETDLNPEIVATVDRMRADTAASAAAAKVSETNASAAMKNALSKVVTTEQVVAGPVRFSSGLTSTGSQVMNAAAGYPTVVLRLRDVDGVEKGSLYSDTSSGVINLRWGGSAYTMTGNADGTVKFPSDVYSGTTALLKTGEYGLGSDFRPVLTGYTLASDYRINGAFYANLSSMTDTFGNTNTHVLNVSGYIARTHCFQLAFPLGADRMGFRRIQNNGVGSWMEVWHTGNTTIDANGFIKKASPIVKLFGDGECVLNEQSQGVTTERLSEGVYRVSGVLGFNGDGAWGERGSGVEIPTDDNKRALVWVESKVLPDGDIEIRTYHRTYETGPYSARNIEAMDSGEVDKKKQPIFVEMPDGTPIDIPAGRWIDLRVEMPASDEPEYVPEPEPENEVILEPEQSGETEQEGQELVQEEPTPGEADPAKEPKE